MNDLRKAAEMALERLESHDYWMDEEAIQALRQALAAEEALDRMVAENQRLGLYDDKPPVKSYCGGKPNYTTPGETQAIEAKLKEKNNG